MKLPTGARVPADRPSNPVIGANRRGSPLFWSALTPEGGAVMCDLPEQVGAPGATTAVTVTGALELVVSGLGWLASADLATVPVAVRADCLRTLEQVRSIYTAAHASVLSAFDQDNGYAADGQGTARTWLRWQTQTTSAAASAAVAWMRRLRDHRGIADAMKAGRITESWGKQICEWTDRLPESARPAADDILLTAAASG